MAKFNLNDLGPVDPTASSLKVAWPRPKVEVHYINDIFSEPLSNFNYLKYFSLIIFHKGQMSI